MFDDDKLEALVNVKYGVAIFLLLSLLSAPTISNATELRDETLNAWNEYVRAANSRMEGRLTGNSPFLWIDEVPERAQRVLQGQILVAPASNSGAQNVPHGLVHDWVGATFIQRATIEDVLAVVNDYNRYHEIYSPAVVNSKLLESEGNEHKFSMIMMQKVLSVKAAIDSQYQSRCVLVAAKRWYCISHSTEVREIKNFGESDEHELPPDEGSGFVWRLYSIARFQERDGGVYAELEAIGLSRDIPIAIRWLVNPIVEHLPRNAVSLTTQQTRDSIHAGMDMEMSKRDSKETLEYNCGFAATCKGTVSRETAAHRPNYAQPSLGIDISKRGQSKDSSDIPQ
jgi:hypothetical protein